MSGSPTVRRWWLLALLLPWLAGAPAARAETLYVIEQVVVSVNSAPDASGERIASVQSGDRLEVIERAGDQVHVSLGNGQDGWVGAHYLSADEPLRARLAQREAEVTRLKDDVSRLQAQLGAARPAAQAAAPASPPARAATPPPAAKPAAPEDSATAQPAAMFSTGADEGPRRVWPWAVGSALAALVAGFVLGALTLDRHIRRKYGGLRIY